MDSIVACFGQSAFVSVVSVVSTVSFRWFVSVFRCSGFKHMPENKLLKELYTNINRCSEFQSTE